MLTETNLPYNDEAERTVVGALLVGADINILIAEIGLQVTDFYLEQNRIVYYAIMRLYEQNKAIDIVTVDGFLRGNPSYSGIEYLKTVVSAVPTTRHMKYYAELVKQMSQRRYYISIGKEIQETASDNEKDIEAVNDIIENAMIRDNEQMSVSSFADLYIPVYKELTVAYEKKGEIPGQKTGWLSLDAAIGGLEGLVVVGARPSMGKTMFGVNIAEYIAFKEDKPALLFSLEMVKNQIAMRIMSSQTGVRHSDCKFGTLSGDDFDMIGQFENLVRGEKLMICDEAMISLSKLKSVSRRFKKQLGSIGAIIIDYIQLMDTGNTKYTTRADELGKISRGLKLLSKELDCPIVALSQLSREVEKRADKRPMLSDLRDSGAIEQDADTIIFLYRDDYYNKQSKKRGVAEIIIAKARHGETRTIELSFQPQIMRFMEMTEVDEIAKRRRKNGTSTKN
ncbi:MAG: replicative DNA helicase [Clostridia bacterium]|nr:replicative DNA helicase [Clostridia bacterium]